MKVKTNPNDAGTKDAAIYEASRNARNAYAREWRAKNREKVRTYNARYWARKAEKEKVGEMCV